jgi:hypothetical protein
MKYRDKVLFVNLDKTVDEGIITSVSDDTAMVDFWSWIEIFKISSFSVENIDGDAVFIVNAHEKMIRDYRNANWR